MKGPAGRGGLVLAASTTSDGAGRYRRVLERRFGF
jgi:hypothetical protein